MRSLLDTQFRALGPALLPLVLLATACGGSNREALEKKVANLTDEVTRVQNANDRLAERLQALEIAGMQGRTAAPQAPAAVEATEERVARPNLKVVKLAPGATTPQAEAELESAPPVEEGGPRPVLRDYGARPPAPKVVPRAVAAPMGQTSSGAPRTSPQGS